MCSSCFFLLKPEAPPGHRTPVALGFLAPLVTTTGAYIGDRHRQDMLTSRPV